MRRLIRYQIVDGYLTIKDLVYHQRKLGLKQKKLEEIAQSSKVELLKSKL